MEKDDIKMSVGRVVRAIGGIFYVEPLTGKDLIAECSVRGKLKLTNSDILVGDKVKYLLENSKGVITEVLPRESILKRPYITNVDLLVVVFAHENPVPNPSLMARFLIIADSSDIPYVLVFNKTDLVGKGKADKLANIYRNYGYQVYCTSTVNNLGKRTLQKLLAGKVSVFTGPSGVGKSALLNMLCPGLKLKTGILSSKISRGKHTTREVQLLKVNPLTSVADTPGFSQIGLEHLKPEELASLFPDFRDYLGKCRFNSCIHQNEPECALKKGLENGMIDPERYNSYLELLKEVKENWAKRYR
ncbi:MAG: ribosome small subunit-dependent GTPase A [Firmicutes bacterium]|nr:ribosome small subunit-dependent GTPase A [Bacillota bacterium]